uniref:Glutamate receptor n=1 Tax=Salix viminalis TaxID=40686 RepID=A0A6N2KDK0_SALVM
MGVAQDTKTIPVKVGVVLDLDDVLYGNIGLSCINMALSDFYDSHSDYKTRLALTTIDSKKDVVRAAGAALDLIKNVEVQAIIGPTLSTQAKFVIELGQKAQVNAISELVKAFGWRAAVPIYIDNEYGEGLVPYLTNALQAVDARIPYQTTDDQIVAELYKLMTMQTRVFIVHMFPSLGARLFAKAKEIGMMSEGYVWIMTDGLTAEFLSSPNPSVTDTMQGVLGIKPHVPSTKELKDFRVRWKRKFQQDNPDIIDADMNIYGLWAYDAATALAFAVEKMADFGFQKVNVSSNSSTDLATLGVSLNGPDLSLSGDYLFVNGKLQASPFWIVNVNGNGGRKVGFWTPTKGLVQTLNSTTTKSLNSSPVSGISTVIWPGGNSAAPKGWEIPSSNGKKLKIGVPVKDGLGQFVSVTRNLSSNTTTVKGYSIDVFEAAVRSLPYALLYEYIPYANPDGGPAGNYDDLIHQKYDAVVGDTTIVSNRSLYVDFTLPYMESGVSMIVPVTENNKKSAWIFLKPLTWDLWVTSFCFFIFIGFVVWVLEHRINEDFRGPPSNYIGTSFWFSFSTMIFAHRERVVNNLSRFVLIIWCFVVLILTQSYTASLTSLLTVKQLQPEVTDVNDLIKRGEYVGYHEGSFVAGILLELGFDNSKLVMYNSFEKCDELFSKGSGNGGISAAFDEAPYMKLFLSKYCSKYTMIEPTFKTAGFGFVFPKGSPLAPDVSRAILNLIDDDNMKQIEDKWFGKQSSCPDSSTSISSNSLSLRSFWGLFLIAGIASLSALLIFTVNFVYQERRVLSPDDPRASMWRRIQNLFIVFDERDQTAHAFRKNEVSDRSGVDLPDAGEPSSLAYSVHTESPGDPPSSECDSTPHRQESQEFVIDIDQLNNPFEERPTAFDTACRLQN